MQEENKSTTQDANFWQQHVDQFQQFKQPKLSYCKQHSLTYHQFLYWFPKLTDDDRPVSILVKTGELLLFFSLL